MQDAARYQFSLHAITVMGERNISPAWVERVMTSPEKIIADKSDPVLCHALGRIAEYDGRVLRVVYNVTSEPWNIVTVYFDRGLRGQL